VRDDEQSVMKSCRLQTRGPAMAKAWSPIVVYMALLAQADML